MYIKENIWFNKMENENIATNTSRIFKSGPYKNDSESGKNNYYTIALVCFGIVIYAIIWLRRKRNREKYIQKKEQEYLNYYHSILPRSRIYGEISDTHKLTDMVESVNSNRCRKISIQYGLANIAGLVLNMNPEADEAEDNVQVKAEHSAKKYKEHDKNLTNDEVSQMSYDIIDEAQVYRNSDETTSKQHNEVRNKRNNEVTCDVHNELTTELFCDEIVSETYHDKVTSDTDNTTNKHTEITHNIHNDTTNISQCSEVSGTHKEICGKTHNKTPCDICNAVTDSYNELHTHDSDDSDTNIGCPIDQNVYIKCAQNGKPSISSFDSFQEGEDDVFTITEDGIGINGIPTTENDINITDIEVGFADDSDTFSVLNTTWSPIHYTSDQRPNRVSNKDRNIQFKRNLNVEHANIKHELCNSKHDTDKHGVCNDDHKVLCNGLNKLVHDKHVVCNGNEDKLDQHNVEYMGNTRNKLESNRVIVHADYLSCTWI